MMHHSIPQTTLNAQHQASDPRRSVWVSANAGSGKTHVLAQRVMRLLLRGVPPSKILCLTFTKAAAANMAAKVFSTLAQWTRVEDDVLERAIVQLGAPVPARTELDFARRLFARTVETPGGLKIQTIHAFCEKLLHLFPFEANVPARFEVVEELRQADLIERARHDALLDAAKDQGALGNALRHLAAETSGAEFDALIKQTLQLRATTRRASDAQLREALGLRPGETRASIERAMVEDGIAPSRWQDIAGILNQGSSDDGKQAERFRQATESHARAADASVCRALYLGVFFTKDDEARKKLITKPLAKKHPALEAELTCEQTRLDALRDTLKAAATLERTAALMAVVDRVLLRYDSIKSQMGLLDFADLVERTRALLQRSDAQWVLYKLDSGIDHILVDEAQDTSAAQWKIFEDLTAEFASGAGARLLPRSFFAVGDDKQSIFSFQGAAPHMFHTMRETFAGKFKQGEEAFEHVRLKASFRSVPAVLDAVDEVFALASHQKGLVPADDVWPVHEAIKHHLPGLIEIWPPQGPAPEDDPPDWRLPLDVLDRRDPPSLVAHRIAQKIGALIRDPGREHVFDTQSGAARPVRPGDVLILVRTRGPFFRAIIRALKQADVPVAGADRLDLTDHIATMDLVAAGRAALLPQDDLTLACVLKSPLFGLDDEDLMKLAPERTGSLFDALALSASPQQRDARAKLATWHERAATMTPFAFYMQILAAEGGRKAMEGRLGPEACDIIDEFLRLALAHEREAAPSLARFLASLEGVDLSIKRDMEAPADAVRVMTVHAAKGLEAKIVFLPDTCSAPGGQHDPKIFSLSAEAGVLAWSPKKDLDPPPVARAREAARDAAEEEYRRLLYVALTRAEERLYIAGFHGVRGAPPQSWGTMIGAALTTGFETVPAFWDADIEIKRRRSGGMGPLPVEASPSSPASAPLATPDWLLQPARAEASPAPPLRPSNALAAADTLGNVARTDAQRENLQRGRLLHVLLQHLPDLAPAHRRQAARAFLEARARDLDQAVAADIVAQVLGVIEAPALAALFGPGSKAEVSVAGRFKRQNGKDVDVVGRVDRIAETATAVLVADFKTGLLPKGGIPETYLTQMALYRGILAPLWPTKPLRMHLIWTAGPDISVLDDGALDAALARVR